MYATPIKIHVAHSNSPIFADATAFPGFQIEDNRARTVSGQIAIVQCRLPTRLGVSVVNASSPFGKPELLMWCGRKKSNVFYRFAVHTHTRWRLQR
jgi:hypothetical protein